jgi:hypothetical protein
MQVAIGMVTGGNRAWFCLCRGKRERDGGQGILDAGNAWHPRDGSREAGFSSTSRYVTRKRCNSPKGAETERLNPRLVESVPPTFYSLLRRLRWSYHDVAGCFGASER